MSKANPPRVPLVEPLVDSRCSSTVLGIVGVLVFCDGSGQSLVQRGGWL
jgi:hypothetical protein